VGKAGDGRGKAAANQTCSSGRQRNGPGRNVQELRELHGDGDHGNPAVTTVTPR